MRPELLCRCKLDASIARGRFTGWSPIDAILMVPRIIEKYRVLLQLGLPSTSMFKICTANFALSLPLVCRKIDVHNPQRELTPGRCTNHLSTI